MPLSTSTSESDSRLLKSRIPRITLILDKDKENTLSNFRCPLRKGIIYYSRHDTMFEHDIYSSSKHEPRTLIANLQKRLVANRFQLIPIKHNRVLLTAVYVEHDDLQHYLHLSIHEIRACRVGPALWTFHDLAHSNIFKHLRPMKSTTSTFGVAFGVNSTSHLKLFDVCTGAEKDYPLIEAGRFNYSQRLNGTEIELSPNRNVLLNTNRISETIDIFYSDSGDTNNAHFSFVTHMPIPNPKCTDRKEMGVFGSSLLAFSADGSKFATGMADGVVSVWDFRRKIPLKVLVVEVPRQNNDDWNRSISFLQFSSGILGKEILVFMENDVSTGLGKIIRLIDATSFETEESLCLPSTHHEDSRSTPTSTLFFDPSGRSMYAEVEGTVYEWDLQKNKVTDGKLCLEE